MYLTGMLIRNRIKNFRFQLFRSCITKENILKGIFFRGEKKKKQTSFLLITNKAPLHLHILPAPQAQWEKLSTYQKVQLQILLIQNRNYLI